MNKLLFVFALLMTALTVRAQGNADYFITTWKTDNPGFSSNTSVEILTDPLFTYNYDVDWENDGTFDDFGLSSSVVHDYRAAGVYQIAIRGNFPKIFQGTSSASDSKKLLSVNQWGSQNWVTMEAAFMGCENVQILASDIPDLTSVVSLAYMFRGATSFNQDISGWDVSNVKSMEAMFFGASSFDQNLGDWNISSVTNMNNMLDKSGLSSNNYDNTLVGWSSIATPPMNINLGVHGLQYCLSVTERQKLIDDNTWTFTGDSYVNCRPMCSTISSSFSNNATNVSADNPIKIDWSSVTGANDYVLTVGTTSVGNDVATYSGIKSNTFNIPNSGLSSGKTYYVNLYSYDVRNTVLNCQEFIFTTAVSSLRPSCVVIGSFSPVNGSSSVELNETISWGAVTDVLGYNLVFYDSSRQEIHRATSITSPSYKMPRGVLNYNNNYCLLVQPYNASGVNTSSCTEYCFKTKEEDVPQLNCPIIRSNLGQNRDNVSVDSPITIAWDYVSGASSYDFIVGTSSGGSDVVQSLNLSGTIREQDISPGNLQRNTTYYVNVIPKGTYGSPASCEYTFKTLPNVPDCTNITSSTLTNNATNVSVDNDITVSWNTILNANTYNFTVGTSSGGTNVMYEVDLDPSDLTRTIRASDLDENTTYYVNVIGKNKGGGSTGCNEFVFTTIPPAPACTTISSPTNTIEVPVNTIFSWDKVEFATSYDVGIGTSLAAEDIYVQKGITGTSLDLPFDLDLSVTYYLRVIPQGDQGEAKYCKDFVFTTGCGEINVGSDGLLNICEDIEPTTEELFSALGGDPDQGGLWSNKGNVFYYTITTSSFCSASSKVVVYKIPSPNAGENGVFISVNNETPTDEDLFLSLGGDPDSGGEWMQESDTSYQYNIVTDKGCQQSSNVSVVVVPELFTPNGDGINDTFFIKGIEGNYEFFELEIFDRIGKKVFKSSQNVKWWNGIIDGSEERYIEDTYFYILTINNTKKQGWVYLKR